MSPGDVVSGLLEVTGLTKTFGGTPAVQDVSFALREGEVLGLVGESGSGKSTTVRCVVGLTEPDAGRVVYDGVDVRTARGAEMRRFRREVQMVFQDPYSSLSPRMTVEEIVGEGLLVHRLATGRAGRRDRVVEVLELVGLSAADLRRHPRSFSGGQRQRIAIARALAVAPRVLICDEPVSALDVSVQAQVINLLQDMRERLGLSVLFIAHDLAVVRQLCERLVVLDQGRVAETGDRDQIYGAPAHPYTQALLAAIPLPDPAAERARRAAGRSST
ncbi:peptide/nickel transport system ATP-binding protein/oligopeptide transport system ATP-binding protein [Actinocorallia herbida]|uniref:Peptide/nickel transport system ATP-binding protein/oligopeptide transport system ATP-binding protein n=1 Tax=Actinocorallia herbida TaxID=58109 RepID=A0A3N1D0D7_9ACTN|nr:ATP-binding cassette domain-containing protein [Actinocorallia herbida]ROO86995.1 peptide/nickel transport system ATP-binding protein/oligopeptide transport system ATP-binding protein [Actinocorallia herbida]